MTNEVLALKNLSRAMVAAGNLVGAWQDYQASLEALASACMTGQTITRASLDRDMARIRAATCVHADALTADQRNAFKLLIAPYMT